MVIDFHAHILPGADHGCYSSAMAHNQLALMKKHGTDAVVATPHFYPNQDSVRSFLARREGAVAAMRRKLPLEDLPTVYLGAEVLVCEGMHEMPDLEALCIAGTKVILLEMPFSAWSDGLVDTVLAIRDRGLTPVLAHIDRYYWEQVEELLKKGIVAQLNPEAFGLFGCKGNLKGALDSGAVVAIGSDLHGDKKSAYRPFLRARKKLAAPEALFAKTAALLTGATPIGQEQQEKIKTT